MEIKREQLAGLCRAADAVEGRSSIRKNGMIDGHILLRDLREWIEQASAAPGQDPIRLFRTHGSQIWEECEAALFEEFLCQPEEYECFLAYTHADPSEAEWLRAELSQRKSLDAEGLAFRKELIQQRDAALRKLAEAQALLRDWLDTPLGASSPAINRLRGKTDYMISATAQPASECEHDWVDATNRYVQSGELCTKCNAIRAAQPTDGVKIDE